MLKSKLVQVSLLATLAVGAVGCKELPGTNEQQGAVIGGASGAAAGAVIGGEKHRLLGVLLGGAAGAAGGYVIGAQTDKIRTTNQTAAAQANQTAQSKPATVQDVKNSSTADLNGDGFVTLDEVVAMAAAGISDSEMVHRLQATSQVFELTDQQKKYLQDHGVSPNVVNQMNEINRTARDQLLQSQAPSGAISSPPPNNQSSQ
jgi:hypothetical protein